jgi:propionyl-CoA carboxylase beta subunit
VGRNHSVAAERATIDDVIMPHATRLRIADKFTQSAQRKMARALAMLRNKHVEMPGRKHDNLPV